ncbi:branched-chain amino acid ABC transporter permease [Pusillimonas noertemannii]|uniref:branched-chain amino acid ABC transporter permease n=1 Tax=Pusillimonas noertemannii TaxID=305977 RepID=UPI0033402CD9
MELILQIFFDSLLLAGLLAVGALGFTLVWGVLNVLNLMYPAFIMGGAYLSYWLWSLGFDYLLTIPITIAVMFCIGWLIQRYLIDYVMNGPHALGITLTYGVNLIVVGLALYYFTATDRSIIVPEYLAGFVELWGIKVPYVRIATTAIALVLTGSAWWFFDKTEYGAAIRATRLDQEAAQLVGIKIRTIFNLTTAISAALAGAMGTLIVLVFSASPYTGDHFFLQIITVTVLGGLGSIIGPLLGAALVGIAISTTSHLIGVTYGVLVGALIVLIVLAVRPKGLLGRRFYEA